MLQDYQLQTFLREYYENFTLKGTSRRKTFYIIRKTGFFENKNLHACNTF